MHKELDVTLVIPNYNHANFLPECLNAVFSQSYIPKEVLLIDNASTDNSRTVLRNYKEKHPQIKLIENPTNQGPVPVYNFGIHHGTGKYIALCAADDLLFPGFFKKTVEALEEHPHAGICCSVPSFFINKQPYQWVQKPISRLSKKTYISPDQIHRKFLFSPLWIPSHSSLFRRESVIECKAFPLELHHIADWYLNIKVAMTHGIVYLPESLGAFRISPTSYGARLNRNYKKKIRIYDHLFKLVQLESKQFQSKFKKSGVLGLLSADILIYQLLVPRLWPFIPRALFRKASNFFRSSASCLRSRVSKTVA